MASATYKYERIAELVRERILGGSYPDGKLPKEGDLAAEFKISRMPVSQALQQLAKEGLVQRVKGKGTFIRGSREAISVSHQVGLLLGGEGHHFWGPLRQAILVELMAHGYFGLPMEGADGNTGKDFEHAFDKALHQMVASPLKGIVYRGTHYRYQPFLRGQDIRSVGVTAFLGHEAPPGAVVLADYEGGARLAVEHLVALGHQRIVYLSVEEDAETMADETYRNQSPLLRSERGYEAAMAGCGLEPTIVRRRRNADVSDSQAHLPHYREIVASGCTAVICQSDVIAVHFVQVALEQGRRVPDDLAIVGMYNTPWCEESLVPITSISFNEQEMARQTVTLLVGDEPCSGQYVVGASLVTRTSSGAS